MEQPQATGARTKPDADVILFVCVACKGNAENGERPGDALLAAVRGKLAGHGALNIVMEPVDCLAVCKRPCTVALTAKGKWTYVIGDLAGDAHADDVAAATLAYASSRNGMIPWRERPQSFRKGVVARIPPLNFEHDGSGKPLEPKP